MNYLALAKWPSVYLPSNRGLRSIRGARFISPPCQISITSFISLHFQFTWVEIGFQLIIYAWNIDRFDVSSDLSELFRWNNRWSEEIVKKIRGKFVPRKYPSNGELSRNHYSLSPSHTLITRISSIMRRLQTIEESRVTSTLDLSLPSISNATTCHALLPPTKSIFEPRFWVILV